MRRYNFFLNIKDVERLRKLARKQGVPMAELVRQALAGYLERAKTA